jgi:hypothetical protein
MTRTYVQRMLTRSRLEALWLHRAEGKTGVSERPRELPARCQVMSRWTFTQKLGKELGGTAARACPPTGV